MIHTRVPESLEAELRQKAEDLGISVSNLVRNVLGHAFGLVGDVVADSHAIARAARGVRPGPPPPPDAPAPPSGARPAPPVPPVPSPAAPPVPGPAADAGVSASLLQATLDDVLAWQPIVLGKNAVCLRCNALMPRGTDGAIGVAESSGARLVICAPCLAALRA